MYVEQEMYFTNGEVSKIMLLQKYNRDNGIILNLGPFSFRVIYLSNFLVQASIIVLTIKFGMSIVQI